MDIHHFWEAVLQQDADKIRMYFEKDAYVNWHCTNQKSFFSCGIVYEDKG